MIDFRQCSVGLLMLTVCASLTAGSLVTVNIESGRGGAILTHEIRVQGQHVRMDTRSRGANQVVLYNHETQSLIVVNEEKKIFRRVRQQDAEQRQQEVTEQQEQALTLWEERIRNLPPEKQAAFRRILNRQSAAADADRMKCRLVSEGTTVGTWQAHHYECFVGSQRVREVWSIPWETTGLSTEETEALKGFIRLRGAASSTPGRPASGGFPLTTESFPGLAVQSLEVRNDKVNRGHEVSRIEHQDFDSALFVVDSSYTEAEVDRFMLPIR